MGYKLMRKCVVSFADDAGNYAKAMSRLEYSLDQVGFDGHFKGFSNYNHIGSPPHKGDPFAVPYAFKAYSINRAIEEGFDLILWCDSVVYATKSIDPIFDHIKEHGYLLFDNMGFSIGDYTSDDCLSHHGMTRDEAFNIRMLMACCMGFNLKNHKAKEFLYKYTKAAFDGVSYHGDWTNEESQVSNDARVKGHRHDQSVASILAHQLGMVLTNAHSTYFSYVAHKGVLPVSDSVCLWSEGI